MNTLAPFKIKNSSMKYLVIAIISLFTIHNLLAQTLVNGVVTDENKQPLKGARVILPGSDKEVLTDEQGKFSIEVNDAAAQNISVEYRGYNGTDVAIAAIQNDGIVQLTPKNVVFRLIDFILHIDEHLADFLKDYGIWVYAILFLIIFIETGVVVMPFLPGDSLLFAAGMLAAQYPESLNVWVVIVLLLIAAVIGDTLNYTIGKEFGNQALKVKIFGRNFVKAEHIDETHKFYEKYGSKTIVIARFVPIVRTLAPFVAGIGRMSYKVFLTYNVVGAFLWVVGVTLVGYFLGNIEIIKENFEKVVLGIIFISVLPIIYAILKERISGTKAA